MIHADDQASVSGLSSGVKDLLTSTDARAAEAIDLCDQACKTVGALAAALGGLDTLVFTAGIGEHAASIRCQICESLEHLGVELDQQANELMNRWFRPRKVG
jgi:acetate kinase